MKFIATLEEVKNILRLKYNLTNDVDVKITELPVANVAASNTGVSARTFVEIIDLYGEGLNSNKKIPAIKMVRTITGCTLAEGKWIVENWNKYKEYVGMYVCYPTITQDGSTFYLS